MKQTNSFSIKLLSRTGYLILILFGIFIVSSCDKAVNYEKPQTENKLVIESYIMEGYTTVNVKVTKTLTPYENASMPFINFDPRFNVIGAVVKLSFDSGTPFLLDLNDNVYYPTTYSKEMKVPFAEKCTLEVEYEGQKVYAETNYPSKTKINNVSVILQKDIKYNGAGVRYMNVEININADFPTDETNYYRILAYGEFVYNNGVNNIFYWGRLSDDYLYFITDGKNKSQNIRFSSYNDLNALTDTNKAIIYLEHITPIHFQFRNALKNQIENIGDEFNTEIVQIPTNIVGGLGIFTAITRDSIWADIAVK